MSVCGPRAMSFASRPMHHHPTACCPVSRGCTPRWTLRLTIGPFKPMRTPSETVYSSGPPKNRLGRAGKEELATNQSCSFPKLQAGELSRPWSMKYTAGWGYSLELISRLNCRYIRPEPTLSIKSSAFDHSNHYHSQYFS